MLPSARSMDAATHSNRTASPSNSSSPSSPSISCAETVVAVQVRPVAGERAHLTEHRSAEHASFGQSRPHVDHPVDRRQGGLGRDKGTVESAHARSDNQVGHDVALEERTKHAHLGRAEDTSAAQHERGETSGTIARG